MSNLNIYVNSHETSFLNPLSDPNLSSSYNVGFTSVAEGILPFEWIDVVGTSSS
jgi:hypothetical protein